ncbi:MAG: hypothetical protein RDV48_18040 [Candidatus Eremiobacteraeota bacterium]|nr:hypothetical protein [Candidatus Eremiobacteraeota bacterium]
MRKAHRKEEGIGTAVALLLLSVLSVVCLTLGTLGIFNLRYTNDYSYKTAARFAAIEGLNEAAAAIYGSSSWTTGFSNTSQISAPGKYYVTFSTSTPYYSTNNANGSSAVTGYKNVSVPPGYVYLISQGNVNGAWNSTSKKYDGGQTVKVATMIKAPVPNNDSAWNYAVFCNGFFNVSGGGKFETGSYNSITGSPSYSTPNDTSGGDVGTNSIAAAIIALGSSNFFSIGGNVSLPPGADSSTAVTNSSKIDGTIIIRTSVISIPIVADFVTAISPVSDVSGGSKKSYMTITPGYYGSLENGYYTLSPGDYSFSNINLGNGAIALSSTTNRVRIYVRGTASTSDIDIDFGNGEINNSSFKSGLLLIYGGTNVTKVNIQGNAEAALGLYTPNATIDYQGTGELYGSFICNNFTLSGGGHGNIFHDAALNQTSVPNPDDEYSKIKSFTYIE